MSTAPPYLSVEELDKLSKEELRKKANGCFILLDTCGNEQKAAVLAQAEFYMRELEHRWDSRISIRDFILEIIVIALIGGEIWMSVRQEKQQSANFKEQQAVLTSMLTSSQTTATTLASLQSTTQTMSSAVQKQVGLFYDVAINVLYNAGTKEVQFVNNGRTGLYIWGWGSEFLKEPPVFSPQGRLIVPGGAFTANAADTVHVLVDKSPHVPLSFIPFEVYLKNEEQKEFVGHCNFVVSWSHDAMTLGTQTLSINAEQWEHKHPPETRLIR
jgi:hypothetical protein